MLQTIVCSCLKFFMIQRSGHNDVFKVEMVKVSNQSTEGRKLCKDSVRPLLGDREILFGVDCRWERLKESVEGLMRSLYVPSVTRAMDAQFVQYKQGNYWLTLTNY